jgi:hypothetical protein
MTSVWTSSSSAPSKNPLLEIALLSESRRTLHQLIAHSAAVRIPTRSSARANACEPRHIGVEQRLSKWSEPEKRSKTSDGPFRNARPRVSSRLFVLPLAARRPHLDRQPDQVDEARASF